MSNGFSVEQMIELILDGQKEVKEELKTLSIKIDNVSLNGCSHRSDDLRRIELLESWKTRGIVGVIATLIMSVGALISAIFYGSPPK